VNVGAYLLLQTASGAAREVLNEVESLPWVESASLITGAVDLVIRLTDESSADPAVTQCAETRRVLRVLPCISTANVSIDTQTRSPDQREALYGAV